MGMLAQGLDGDFYGTAVSGGLYKGGTIFKITPNGAFTLLYTFPSNNDPSENGLILASDGNFYGASGQGFYRITSQGIYTQLPGLNGSPNSFIQGSDGNLYGSTQTGGQYGYGFLFQTTLSGQSTNVYSFLGYPKDGSVPLAGLVQYTDGKFYGTTFSGGPATCNYGRYPGCGTIFSLDMGLAPFVTFVNRAARLGQRFGILGQGFTGTTNISLNGTPASFTVNSDTLIVATVPTGATAGLVTVSAPGGMLTSSESFYVIP